MTFERREFARTLRKHPTPAEDKLWQRLRGSRFHGAKFRRQVPFDRYVVDFYCHAAKLVCVSSASPTPKSAPISTPF